MPTFIGYAAAVLSGSLFLNRINHALGYAVPGVGILYFTDANPVISIPAILQRVALLAAITTVFLSTSMSSVFIRPAIGMSPVGSFFDCRGEVADIRPESMLTCKGCLHLFFPTSLFNKISPPFP